MGLFKSFINLSLKASPLPRSITSFRNIKRIRSPNLFTNDRKNEKPNSRAPEEAFTLQNASEDPAKWNYVSSCWEFDATPEQFQVWVKKFYELMAELNEITKGADKDPNSKPYYISTTALQIAERTMR